jgi:hypothetical protein
MSQALQEYLLVKQSKVQYKTGFNVTGIHPLNASVFNEDEFLSSCVPDRPYSQVTASSISLTS